MIQNHPVLNNTLLPAPFEWIMIPAGTVTLKAGGYLSEPTTFEVAPFAIGKYPITNQQYAPFIAADGYADQTWWTDIGWQHRVRHGITAPRYWGVRDFNDPNAPVMGVTWFEAVAYCNWLSAQALTPTPSPSEQGKLEITIPTEQQWQRAAQGDDGREFPWGNVDPKWGICNYARNANGTTPVTEHPNGASPFGVMDMSGNVWELTRTGWETGTDDLDSSERRIVRGGSWVNDSPITLLTTLRDGPYPADGYHLYGFRIAIRID
ncbi:MAG: SUMF1/EgtB/PvdO family nonheme iron enzyme [Anaerolineae bacterium]|nr:SUMF1/EgtB/PvdO family nonheme iron enzyme [Anaerolineae bacterium]